MAADVFAASCMASVSSLNVSWGGAGALRALYLSHAFTPPMAANPATPDNSSLIKGFFLSFLLPPDSMYASNAAPPPASHASVDGFPNASEKRPFHLAIAASALFCSLMSCSFI
jgi:hypothetical protein